MMLKLSQSYVIIIFIADLKVAHQNMILFPNSNAEQVNEIPITDRHSAKTVSEFYHNSKLAYFLRRLNSSHRNKLMM